MAFISRRRLAHSLERVIALVSDISHTKMKDWVARLDTISDDYLATEWELILLEAFSEFGIVRYEPSQIGPIDVVFKNEQGVAFAADITTVTDWSLHRKNPVDMFSSELGRYLRKTGIIRFGGFSYNILQKQGLRGRERPRVPLLPHVSLFRKLIFNAKWTEFIDTVRLNPTVQHVYYAFTDESTIKISYLSDLKGHLTGSYAAYTGAHALTDNPLYHSLRRKAQKLKKFRYPGPVGIVVCDGGCKLLTDKATWETYSARDIVTEFFRQHQSIDFVGIIAIESRFSTGPGMRTQHSYSPILYCRSGSPFDISSISEVFHNAVKGLPAIKAAPNNVIYKLKWHRPSAPYRPYLGGWTYSESASQLSARELLEVLSGRMPHHVFHENHQLGNGSNSFVMRIARGQQITGIKLHKQPEEDDDLVTLEFAGKDNQECRSIDPKEGLPNKGICIDAKILLYFLAGTIDFSEFSRLNGASNCFLNHLEAGELFSDLTLRQQDNQSTIRFDFSEPDPAVAPFRQLVSFAS